MPTKKPKAKSARAQKTSVVEHIMLEDMAALFKSLGALKDGPAGPDNDRLDEAQEFIFEAWEAPTKARRVALARKALAISPLCADALTILAQAAPPMSDEALDLHR